MVAMPIFVYAGMNVMWAMLSGSYLPLVLGASVLALAAIFIAVSVAKKQSGPFYSFVSFMSAVSFVFGIMCGLSIQARFFGPYWNYHHHPVYTNVLATDPAAARSDAGIISFADNAVVDTMRIGNFFSSKGTKFCAAPILDESQQSAAEFWAVGMDCCEGHVSFFCDDAQDVSARSGAVVFEVNSWLVRDPYSKYMSAVKQAAARNQIEVPKNPILVRWVKDPATVTDGLWKEGVENLVVGIIVYTFAAMGLGFLLHFTSGA